MPLLVYEIVSHEQYLRYKLGIRPYSFKKKNNDRCKAMEISHKNSKLGLAVRNQSDKK